MREISLAILDIAQNSVDAGADLIEISLTRDENGICFTIADNGCGMSEIQLKEATEKGVSFKGSTGLGLALLKEETELSDGGIEISSTEGVGTTVKAKFKKDASYKIGKLGDTFAALIDEGYDAVLILDIFGTVNRYDTRELKSSADVATLQSSGALRLIREDINEKTNGGAML